MSKISDIDNVLSSQMDLLKYEIDRLEFEKVCEFEIQPNAIEVPLDKMDYPGVYLFEIKADNQKDTYDSWIKKFVSEWTDEKYLKNFTSNPKKTRYKKHTELSEWMPVYLGKSKKIKSRVKQHLFQELSQKTFAMKFLLTEIYDTHQYGDKQKSQNFKDLRQQKYNFINISSNTAWSCAGISLGVFLKAVCSMDANVVNLFLFPNKPE